MRTVTNSQLHQTVLAEKERTPIRLLWGVVVVLALAEIVPALLLAWINPIRGYDENWYLINSFRFEGITTLPYAHHRPPLLPMLIALFGDYAWLLPGLAHIGGATLTFLILRRLLSPGAAIAGVILFMANGSLRYYNMHLLTELPSILFLLLAIYLFVLKRPCLLGVSVILAAMTHWSNIPLVPIVLMLYVVQRRWHTLAYFVGGAALAASPFLIYFAVNHGGPLAPIFANFEFNTSYGPPNSRWYYLREWRQLPVVLFGGGLVALGWLWANRRKGETHPHVALCLLLLAILAARLATVHIIAVKSPRFLVLAIPILILLSMLMLRHCASRSVLVRSTAYVVLLVSVLPGRELLWEIHALRDDPTHQIAYLSDHVVAHSPSEPVYTDIHDLAVIARTRHPAIAVDSEKSARLWLRLSEHVTRKEIPEDALYLTWDPEAGEPLATRETAHHGRLWLVRWRAGNSSPSYADRTLGLAAHRLTLEWSRHQLPDRISRSPSPEEH